MSSPNTIPPPPGFDPTQVKDTPGSRVKGAIGGFMAAGTGLDFSQTPLGKQLAQKHQALIDKAALHHKNVSTFAGVLATGMNPNTGQPLTDAERQQYQNWYNQEWAEYQKIAGHDKDAKGRLAKVGAVLEHVIGRGQGGQQQQPGAQGMPPPPGQSASASASASEMPPPPERTAMEFPSEQVQQQGAEAAYRRKSDVDTANKIKVEQAKPHRMQAKMVKGPNGPVMANYDPESGQWTDLQGQNIDNAEPYIKPSAAMLPKLAWTMRDGKPIAMMRDPQTNQMIPGTENPDILPPPGMLEHVHEGEFSWVDADGIMHRTPTKSVTRPVLPSGSTSAAPSGGKAPVRRTSAGAAASASVTPKHSGPRGDRIIGDTGKMSAADRMVSAEAVKLADKAKPMVDILDASEDYFKSGKYTPRQDLGIIVRAVRAMNPGSVRLPQKELELEIKAGSYGDRFSRWYSSASTGLLPDDQRADLMNVIRGETSQTAKSAAEAWESAFEGKKPVPPYLKRFGSNTNGIPPPPSTGAGNSLSPEAQKFLQKHSGK